MTIKKLKKLATDAEILYAIKDLAIVVDKGKNLINWYFFFKESDPKFSAACSRLESIHFRGRKYRKALKECLTSFKAAAFDSDWVI